LIRTGGWRWNDLAAKTDRFPDPKRGPLTKAPTEEVRKMSDIDFRLAVRDSFFGLENSLANIDLSLSNHLQSLQSRMDNWQKFTWGLMALLGVESVALLFTVVKSFAGVGG